MINKRKNTIIEKNNEIIQKLSKPVVEYHKIENIMITLLKFGGLREYKTSRYETKYLRMG